MKTAHRPPRVLHAALALTLGGTTLLTVCAGCATLGEPPLRVVVQAIGADQFRVDEQDVNGKALVRAVRRTGASTKTEIQIHLAPGVSPDSLRLPYAALQRAGYYKVLFATTRHATATVSEHPPSAPPAARRRPNP